MKKLDPVKLLTDQKIKRDLVSRNSKILDNAINVEFRQNVKEILLSYGKDFMFKKDLMEA